MDRDGTNRVPRINGLLWAVGCLETGFLSPVSQSLAQLNSPGNPSPKPHGSSGTGAFVFLGRPLA